MFRSEYADVPAVDAAVLAEAGVRKRLITAKVLKSFHQDADELAGLSARLFASADAREGTTAFLERRDPPWVL